MAFIEFHDETGKGGVIRSSTFNVFQSEGLVSDDNIKIDFFEPGINLYLDSFNELTAFAGIYVDYLTAEPLYTIQSIYVFDAKIEPVMSISDIEIAFDPRDNFYAAIASHDWLSGDDSIFGNRFADFLQGGRGNDWIFGNGGADKLFGQKGRDNLFGGDGRDHLSGSSGRDWVSGGTGHDELLGGTGRDFVDGGAGDDMVFGGQGRDRLSGGKGEDSFVYTSQRDSSAVKSSADVILDFQQGRDVIDLSMIDASIIYAGNNRFTFDGEAAIRTSRAGDITFEQFDLTGTDRDHTMVWIDRDTDRDPEMAIRINGLFDLTADDFIL